MVFLHENASTLPILLQFPLEKHLAHVFLCFKSAKAQHLPFMFSIGLQYINGNFFLIWKRLNILGGISFVVWFVLNTLFLLLSAVSPVIPSAASILFQFNLEKHHSYFAINILITVNLFFSLF